MSRVLVEHLKIFKQLMKPLLFLLLGLVSLVEATLPKGFDYITERIPSIELDMKYCGEENFVGAYIDGYLAPKAILSSRAITSLAKVQKELNDFGLGLKIFDAYRPQKAVDHFVRWGHDLSDKMMKESYYPMVLKRDLFRDGYIAKHSGHSRGSTIDLTIIDLATKVELDMGSSFDFFGKSSWVRYAKITAEQKANRMLLNILMLKYGFKDYDQEWWHFTLKNEPYKKTYFNFDVK
ncbi:MAG: D-alanyl-D-alanine dipeptidase (EC [uncultured Sulfurovum sp.]|uniref:D-alanyl-D-alanine dipeptidase n=2 Tax=uncultured Sulfurovum sp. TaxID=269237 RepID=A0A6S6TUE1_9BACT|nr:MAG: D-alanyl-D-alanine dipeptidase (EC [uncultured Sulfurovum sp.]